MPIPVAAPAKFSEEPVIMPSKIKITASIGSIPALVIIGMAIEPIIIIAPSPLMPKKIKAVAAVIKIAIAIGLSPESSAAFLIIASDMPVFWMILANMEPKTTRTIGILNLNEPLSKISFNHSKNGIPHTNAIQPAISGNAKSVGSTRTTINAAKSAKPTKSKMPDSVKDKTSQKNVATTFVAATNVTEFFQTVKNFSDSAQCD